MNDLSHLGGLKARLTRADRLATMTALLQRMLADKMATEALPTAGRNADAPQLRASDAFAARLRRDALGGTSAGRLSPPCRRRCAAFWTASDKSAPPRTCPQSLAEPMALMC